MLYVLNIGNTNTQYAEYDSAAASFREIKSCPTLKLSAALFPDNAEFAVASVVPAALKVFPAEKTFVLTYTKCLGIDFSRMDAAGIGADRLANAMSMAYFSETFPAICIDFGTAITFEVLDRSKVFAGGAILPGRLLLRKALNSFTAQLPLVEISHHAPESAGTNTKDAIFLGVDRGALGAVKEILSSLKKSLDAPDAAVIAAGGDADFFLRAIPDLRKGGIDFTLKGIFKAWELNRS